MASKIPSEEQEYSYDIKIPKDRIAVLIGKEGKIKKELEKETNSKITVDSNEGDVTISGKDSIGLFSAKEVVTAISRGFNPDIAKLLLKQDYLFEIVSLNDFASTPAEMMRLKGRVIGQEGRSRKIIEEMTETNICIYGKTIGIIGLPDNLFMAKQAIVSLLQGSRHATVFKNLEQRRKELKKPEFIEKF
jgi:ribosomal RNA assembly protein